MTYTGTVKNGVIVLPPNVELADGTEVDITPRNPAEGTDSLADAVSNLARPRPHLPNDYALNHGHYVRGEPMK
jgi:hypothetical protein